MTLLVSTGSYTRTVSPLLKEPTEPLVSPPLDVDTSTSFGTIIGFCESKNPYTCVNAPKP